MKLPQPTRRKFIAGALATGCGTSMTETMSVGNIASQSTSTAISVSGSISGVLFPPTLNYSISGGNYTPLPTGNSVTTTTFAFTVPAITTAGSYFINVKDTGTGTSAASNTFTVTAPSVGGAARYWRVLLVIPGSFAYAFAEIQFRAVAGTSQLFPTDTVPPIFVSSVGYNDPGNLAADNNTATYWAPATTNLEYWGYDYGAGNTFLPAEVSMTSTNDPTYYTFAPAGFYLQNSADNVNWVVGQLFTPTWTGPTQTQLFEVSSSNFSTRLLPYSLPAPVSALNTQISSLLYNWSPSSQFSRARTAMARITGNNGRFVVAFIGDSTTLGFGSTVYHLDGAPAGAAAFIGTVTNNAVQGSNNSACVGNPFGTESLVDTRITLIGDATQQGPETFGGQMCSFNTTSTGGVNFAASVAFNTIRVCYAQFGSFTVGVDGGVPSATQAATNGLGSMTSQTWSVPLGTHTVNLAGVTSGTACYVQSIECYNTNSYAIECVNGGIGGSTSGSWNGATTGATTITGTVAENPDLAFINLGINDGNSAQTPQATYQTNIQAMVSALQANGTDVILVVPTPIFASSPMESGQTFWSQYRTALENIATSSNCPVIDLHTYYVSEAYEQARQWMYDTIHPNGTFYADIGSVYAELILAAGGYLTS